MSNSTLGVDVKATANFSAVEREAARASRNINRGFAPLSGAPKALRDVERHLREIDRLAARLGNTQAGRGLRDRVVATGQDLRNPRGWDWTRIGYGSQTLGDRYRRGFESGHYNRQQGFVSAGLDALQRARQGAIDNGSWDKAKGAWGATGRAIGPVAALAGVGSVMGLVIAGYREHLKTIESLDSVYKSMGSTLAFDQLGEDSRKLSRSLQLSSAEGAKLVDTFMRQSGALDAGMLGRAEAAGKFGRGYGLDPNATAGLFARAELVGVGGKGGSQREFAAILAHTIGQSGMAGRSEQVMGDLVAQIEKIASTQARTASGDEIARYGSLMGAMYQDPALRGGGAASIYGALQSEGGGGGIAQEALAWQAFGPAAGYDPALVKLYQEIGPEQSAFDVLGYGSKKTRMELTRGAMGNMAGAMPGSSSELQAAYLANQMYGTPIAAGIGKERLMGRLGASGIDYGAFSGWLGSVGASTDGVDLSSYPTLERLYRGRGDTSQGHADWLRKTGSGYLKGGKVPAALSAQLEAALAMPGASGAARLQELLPKIAAGGGVLETPADVARRGASDMMTGLESLGKHLVPLVSEIKSFTGELALATDGLINFTKTLPGNVANAAAGAVVSRSPGEAVAEMAERGRARRIEGSGIMPLPGSITPPDNLVVSKRAKLHGVDPRLLETVKLAAMANPDLEVEITSGVRKGGLGNHDGGHALDVQLRDRKTGRAYVGLGSRSGHGPGDARMYEKFWQDGTALFGGVDPSFNPRAGVYFSGGPHPMDGMHLDTTPGAPRASGGNLVAGASAGFNRRWGGFSKPMIGGSMETHRQYLLEQNPGLLHSLDRLSGGYEMPPRAQSGPGGSGGQPWRGEVSVDILLRDSNGNIAKHQNTLGVSEPRIPGSSGERVQWTDAATMPRAH